MKYVYFKKAFRSKNYLSKFSPHRTWHKSFLSRKRKAYRPKISYKAYTKRRRVFNNRRIHRSYVARRFRINKFKQLSGLGERHHLISNYWHTTIQSTNDSDPNGAIGMNGVSKKDIMFFSQTGQAVVSYFGILDNYRAARLTGVYIKVTNVATTWQGNKFPSYLANLNVQNVQSDISLTGGEVLDIIRLSGTSTTNLINLQLRLDPLTSNERDIFSCNKQLPVYMFLDRNGMFSQFQDKVPGDSKNYGVPWIRNFGRRIPVGQSMKWFYRLPSTTRFINTDNLKTYLKNENKSLLDFLKETELEIDPNKYQCYLYLFTDYEQNAIFNENSTQLLQTPNFIQQLNIEYRLYFKCQGQHDSVLESFNINKSIISTPEMLTTESQ